MKHKKKTKTNRGPAVNVPKRKCSHCHMRYPPCQIMNLQFFLEVLS